MKNTKNNLPFDPRGQIFHWGPVPGRYLYVSLFVDVHSKYFRAKYGENWSETLWLFKDGRMFWINNLPDIQAAGLRVFLRYLLPTKTRKKIYLEWCGYVKKLLETQKIINKTDLQKLTDRQLKMLWNEFHKICIKFWVAGSIPELANYGSENYLKEKLKSQIKTAAGLAGAMEILTAPTRLSFYQKEEVDLFKTSNLEKHQQKYFWLKNSYAGTEVLPVGFFIERRSRLNKNLGAEMEEKIKETVAKKKIIQKQYFLIAETMKIAEAISDGVGWQDERKKYIFMILHHEDIMLKEVTRRFGYTDEELHRAWYYEIEEIVDGKNLHTKLEKRGAGFGVRFFHDCRELNSVETKNFWRLYETKINQRLTETKGIVACTGKIAKMRGKVHILLDPKDVERFKDGEILVAPMTSPEYIFAMKKAGAVVTDTGGLTSHAAIVSRELDIPCVVGARGTTTIFKDGDTMEIDITHGIIRLIK